MKSKSFSCNAVRSAFALAAVITNASAADIAGGNGSFETNTFTNPGFFGINGLWVTTAGSASGWTFSGSGRWFMQTDNGGNNFGAPQDGDYYLNISLGEGGFPFSMSTTLTGLTIGNNYAVEFYASERSGITPGTSFSASVDTSSPTSLTVTEASLPAITTGFSNYVKQTLSFTATAATHTLTVSNAGTGGGGNGFLVDNFTFVDELSAAAATWSGTTDGTWADSDTTSSNFSGSSFSAAKALSNVALFGDTAAGGGPVSTFNVTVGTGGASIGSVLLENTVLNSYVFNSADATGITGATAVTKTGNGTVTFSGANTYSGGTTISGGTLVVGNGSALGATSGALALTGGAAILDMDTFTGTVGSLSIIDGTITGSGGTLNAGAITVGNGTNPPATVGISGITLAGSSFKVQGNSGNGSGAGLSTPVTISSGTLTTSGDLGVGRWAMTIAGDSTVTVGGVIGGGGIVSTPDWGTLTIQDSAVVTATGGVNGNAEAWQLNLNGGTLNTPSIQASDREDTTYGPSFARLVFNGTTVVATGHNSAFVTVGANSSATNSAFVGNYGAIFDSAGFDIGIGVNLKPDGGSTGGLTKQGSGTLTLSGTNTYTGDTTVDAGTLVLADDAQLKFVVADAQDANRVTGSGTATFNGDFTIDTAGVSGSTGYIWLLVERDTLTGESFGSTFSIIGFDDTDDDGIWIRSDDKGDWSFDESTGELTLDAGNDYDDWGSAYGLAQGSEAGDLDNDGLTNEEEYAFGLIPDSGASVNPISVPLDKATGTFRYTRRATPTNTGLTYTVWTSTDLVNWTEDAGATASQSVTGTVAGVETVEATITGTLPLAQPKLFIQVRAE